MGMKGLRTFLLRGNIVDLAVAVVMGAAFGAVVTALVKDLITPIIAAFVGKPDFSGIVFTVNNSKFLIGDFINAVVSFLLIGSADHQELYGVSEQCSYRGAAMCFLHLATGLNPL